MIGAKLHKDDLTTDDDDDDDTSKTMEKLSPPSPWQRKFLTNGIIITAANAPTDL